MKELFGGVYQKRRVLLTGHTGFKGSWLAAWLARLDATVVGYALDPCSSPNHWDLTNADIQDCRGDILDLEALRSLARDFQPEIVFHLAAQSLVRASYKDPVATWATNVQGTVNLLEACRGVGTVKAIVAVTTDKVYSNREWDWGYREIDTLGGHDPYSASKAASELVAASYRSAFFHSDNAPLLATARAGNVIGGGDWSVDRLVPDLVRAVASGTRLEIRSPRSTRPWQHVLETLSGYLLLGQRLFQGDRAVADSWNFGPDMADNRTVAEILGMMHEQWPQVDWFQGAAGSSHEANLLYLDSAKARGRLGWQPVWRLPMAIAATADWYQQYLARGETLTDQQLDAYVRDAQAANLCWAEACC